MKIISLVINHFVNDNRVYKMANTLQEVGNDVKVVALHKEGLPREEVFNGVRVHRVRPNAMSLPDGNKLFGLLKYASFTWLVIRKYRKMDAWHCNDFEAMLIGFFAKMTRPKLKLVYDCHEYERERYGIGKAYLWFVRVLEPLVIRFAKSVIVVSEGIRVEYERLYHPKSLVLIMNCPHLSTPEHTNRLREACNIRPDQVVFLYQGLMSPGRGIARLLEVFSAMKDDHRVMVFMGNGKLVDTIKDYASRFPNIRYHASVPYSEIMSYTAGADFGFNTMENVTLNYYYAMPNKLFEYMHAAIPIITNNIYDCRKIVEEGNCGVVIEEYTVEGVNDAIRRIEAAPRDVMVHNLERLRLQYQWKNEEKKLIDIYSNIQK